MFAGYRLPRKAVPFAVSRPCRGSSWRSKGTSWRSPSRHRRPCAVRKRFDHLSLVIAEYQTEFAIECGRERSRAKIQDQFKVIVKSRRGNRTVGQLGNRPALPFVQPVDPGLGLLANSGGAKTAGTREQQLDRRRMVDSRQHPDESPALMNPPAIVRLQVSLDDRPGTCATAAPATARTPFSFWAADPRPTASRCKPGDTSPYRLQD